MLLSKNTKHCCCVGGTKRDQKNHAFYEVWHCNIFSQNKLETSFFTMVKLFKLTVLVKTTTKEAMMKRQGEKQRRCRNRRKWRIEEVEKKMLSMNDLTILFNNHCHHIRTNIYAQAQVSLLNSKKSSGYGAISFSNIAHSNHSNSQNLFMSDISPDIIVSVISPSSLCMLCAKMEFMFH